jgi:hypothetical protein
MSKRNRQHNGRLACSVRRVWWHKGGGNQKTYVEEEQTTQRTKEESLTIQKEVIRRRMSKRNRQHNGQRKMDKQRSTKHYRKRWRNTNPTKTVDELMCSGRIGSSCSTSGIRRIARDTNPINHEWGKGREVFTTSGTYPWPLITIFSRNVAVTSTASRYVK